MNWTCPHRINHVQPGEYFGHALEPERDSRTWRCSSCHSRFAMPDDPDGGWMDPVDVEDEPESLDVVEATAVALACAASTIRHDVKLSRSIRHYTDRFSSFRATHDIAWKALERAAHRTGRDWYAEAEALVRTGE